MALKLYSNTEAICAVFLHENESNLNVEAKSKWLSMSVLQAFGHMHPSHYNIARHGSKSLHMKSMC